MSIESDENFSLIQRIARGDRQALSILYDRLARVVYAVAYRSLGSVEESEEIVMDVFAKIWMTANTYNPQKSRVDSWIFMITRSRIIDRLRSQQRRGKLTNAIATFDRPSDTADPALEVEAIERRDRVVTALASLPAEQRQVLEMAYYGGWSHREIAERTGWAVGTVKTRIRLGLDKLRSHPQLTEWSANIDRLD